MTDSVPDIAADAPFEILKSARETDGDFVRFAFTLHPDSSDGAGVSSLDHEPWVGDNPDEHVHPTQEEHMSVESGSLRVIVGETDRTLTEGEEITLPRNVPHRHFNATGQPARVHLEHRPARRSAELFSTFYALAQAGRADADGLPSPLQFAVLQDAYPDHAYTTSPPVWMQKGLIALLAPVGRALGYSADPVIGEDFPLEG
jgi:mannose-6-phosphate isomerase-like protein (cupin superfamily)